MSFSILIPGDPIPKGRPKMTKTGHAYTPQRTRDYEASIGWAWREAGHPLLDGPLTVYVVVHEQKYPADLDNYVKCLDALNGIAFADDKQIEVLHARIIRDHPNPSLEIEVSQGL